ncbi:MAG: DUF1800 domain-containing protein [Candidatus Binatia bacterium]
MSPKNLTTGAQRAWTTRIGLLAAAILTATFAGAALAAPQSSDQQGCLNQLTKAGTDVVKQQGKTTYTCLRNAQYGKVDKLGDVGETLTAQACLTNDVGGKVAQKQQRTADRDAQHCVAEGAPDFAYAGAAAINVAASAAPRAIVASVFGANLDAALVDADVDANGAKCQQEVLRGANRILDTMWRVARTSVQNGLKGKSRRAGAASDLPAYNAGNLVGEVLAQSMDDLQGKIQKDVDRLASKALQRCTTATTPLTALFPGACASPVIATLVECVAGVARGDYYQSVAGTYATAIACDLTDDGLHDGSCVGAADRRHVLDRVGYGPDAWTFGRIVALGLNGYIDEQLAPDAIDDSAAEAVLASNYPTLALSVVEVRDCYPQNVPGTCPGLEGGVKNDVWKEMEESEIYRAVATRRQLEAVLVDFWFNHFNVTGSAGQQKWNTPAYLRDSIRPWVLDNFEDSVLRMARGPAMLDYLDQRQNQVGVPPGTGYNENFPRELLELHTMGVTGAYTETDVKEMARALTGWREEWNNENNFDPDYPGFRYQDSRHDYLGAKLVLGQVINSSSPNGEQDGFTAVSLASRHPDVAPFVCGKLVRRFVHDDPPFLLVDACATAFIAHQNDADQLPQVMAVILKSREFQVFPEYRKSRVKKPVVLIPSVLRAVGADPDPAVTDYRDMRNLLADLGERIRNADPPTGYPDVSVVWASPGAIVQRFNLLETAAVDAAASWGVSGAQPSADVVDDVIAVLFPVDGVAPATRTAAIAYLGSIAATDVQKVQQAGAFLLASRDFLTY